MNSECMAKESKAGLIADNEHALPDTPPDSSSETRSETPSESELVGPDLPAECLPPPSTEPTAILDIDKNTPDAHVPRDPRLIRLTGVHPFNVEPPLSALFNEGFLTSPELFYVRNHGPVPQVSDESVMDWEFTVEGSVIPGRTKIKC